MENLSAIVDIQKRMINMKKHIAVGAALVFMCCAFTGCGSNKKAETDNSSMHTTEHVTERATEARTEEATAHITELTTHENTVADTRPTNSAGEYVGDVIDGVESAGEDIVRGAGDAVGDIADGIMGNNDETSATDSRSR